MGKVEDWLTDELMQRASKLIQDIDGIASQGSVYVVSRALYEAEKRAAADARSDTAARFIAFMTTGNDRDINITVYRQTAAISEDKEQG